RHGIEMALRLLNHRIRPPQQRRWNRQAERLGGLEVDHQVELGGLFDRQVPRLGAFQDLVDIGGGAHQYSPSRRRPYAARVLTGDGPVSAASISSKERPLVSKPMNQ